MMRFTLIFLFCLSSLSATLYIDKYEPWRTGPIIAIPADTLPQGTIVVEPSIIFDCVTGAFDHHSHKQHVEHGALTIWPDLVLETGLTNWLTVRLDFPLQYTQRQKASSVNHHYDHAFYLSDLMLYLQFSLLQQKKHTYIPSLLFYVSETFPTGKFDHLGPTRQKVDKTGNGTYLTTLNLCLSKEVFWFPWHPIAFTLNFGYSLPTKVHVHSFNTYGGGYGTNGYVKPQKILNGSLSIEYSCNQRWVLALETFYYQYSKSTFSGEPGRTLEGDIPINTKSQGAKFEIVPELEYNFSKTAGITLGVIYTAWGKNIDQKVGFIVDFIANY